MSGSGTHFQNRIARRAFLIGTLCVGGAAGCQNITRRGQSPDESLANFGASADRDTKYIGQVTGVWGLNYAVIEGIGLAGDLHGTGSNPFPGSQLEHLLKELRTREELRNPKTLLASEDTSMVLVRGFMPPGIRKGDHFDLEIQTHAKSKTTSLLDGRLSRTRLRTVAVMGRKVHEGHVLGLGRGPILVDALFESRQDESNLLRGWVPQGGIALEDRPLGLTVRADGNSFRQVTMIARAINDRFTAIENQGRVGVAVPKSDKLIELQVPAAYRHDVTRFMQVVRNIAYEERLDERVDRLSELEKQLSDGASCATAAARLEAIGEQGIPALSRALKHPDLEVRFNAAHSLAWLGDATGVEQLYETAETEPAFRWHALSALASLDTATSRQSLLDLMNVESAETRYGAFRSLKIRSPEDSIARGERLSGEFDFHVVPTKARPMIHVSKARIPEIVLFGARQTVTDDLLFVRTGLTVKATGNDHVRVTRYIPGEGEITKVCSNMLADLIPVLASANCSYSMMIEFLRDADASSRLNSRLVVDALPGRKTYDGDSEDERSPTESEQSTRYVSSDLPDMFRAGQAPEKRTRRDDVARLTPDNGEENSSTRKPGNWSRMNNPLHSARNR